MPPKKADALSYLASRSAAPARYARAVVQFGATLEPYIQEFQVGPLPVANGSTILAPLDFVYNKGKGYQRVCDADAEALAAFTSEIGAGVADITKPLLNGVSRFLQLSLMLIFLIRLQPGLKMIPLQSQAALH